MATTRRSATFADTPETLWATVADPHHLPRWWPGVQRVEDVDPESFTQVLEGRRGQTVREDYAVVEQTDGRRCRWRRKPAGTPVERILGRVEVTIELSEPEPAARGGGAGTPGAAGTLVTLTLRKAPGCKPFGTVRRAGRAELDEALAELGRIHG
jgi:uncharacterized protein YndB with AHSA1/START domain